MNAEGLPENYKKHSIIDMVKGMEKYKPPVNSWVPGPPTLPSLFIDCGDDDILINQNMNLVKALKEKEIPFEFRVNQGAHNWDYWRTSLESALVWIGEKFRDY
jgi:S-formylglutathione hydrolase FrmB